MSRINTTAWPDGMCPVAGEQEAYYFHPLGVTKAKAMEWYRRVRKWRVDFVFSQPQSGGPAITASSAFTLENDETDEKDRICGNGKIRYSAEDLDLGGLPPLEVDCTLMLFSRGDAPSDPIIIPDIGLLDRLRINDAQDTYFPQFYFSMFLFKEGSIDAGIVSSEAKADYDNSGGTPLPKYSFSAAFDGMGITFWFLSAASEPDPGPASWTINIFPYEWYEFATKEGSQPILDSGTGAIIEGMDPIALTDPLA